MLNLLWREPFVTELHNASNINAVASAPADVLPLQQHRHAGSTKIPERLGDCAGSLLDPVSCVVAPHAFGGQQQSREAKLDERRAVSVVAVLLDERFVFWAESEMASPSTTRSLG
jgi:hypothetical protein